MLSIGHEPACSWVSVVLRGAAVISYAYQYTRAPLMADCVVFELDEQELKVMSIQRGLSPFEGKWALPGGFARLDETCDVGRRGCTGSTSVNTGIA
jgi:hypothetical protein